MHKTMIPILIVNRCLMIHLSRFKSLNLNINTFFVSKTHLNSDSEIRKKTGLFINHSFLKDLWFTCNGILNLFF